MKEKIRVSDYIAKFLESRGITKIFMVTGGGAMFLNDGIAKSKKIKGIFILYLLKNRIYVIYFFIRLCKNDICIICHFLVGFIFIFGFVLYF